MSRSAARGALSTATAVVKQWRPPPALAPTSAVASTSRAAALHQQHHHHHHQSSAIASPTTAFDPSFFTVDDASVSVVYSAAQPHASSSSSAHGSVPRAFTSLGVPIDSGPTASTSLSAVKPSSSSSTATNGAALADLSTRSIPLSFVSRSTLTSSARTTVPPISRPSYVFSPGAAGLPKQRARRGQNPGGTWDSALVRGGSIGGDRWAAASSASVTDADNLSVQVGEDAFFLRTDSLGVADGVGGWSGHKGADPALFSRKLMHHCSAELARYDDIEDELFSYYYDVEPVEILHRAFEKSLEEANAKEIVGSSTALLAVLRHDELRLANMGDCSCSIIRGQEYIFRTEEQQHSFNFPVQLGTNSKDTPKKDAQHFTVKVQKDDIVILASDGLSDNLFDEDILEEVLRFARYAPSPSKDSSNGRSNLTLQRFSPQAVSEALCHRAKAVAEDQRAVTSPFQQRAMEEGIHYVGGKNDDITCLVAVVGDQEDSPDRR